MRALIALGGNAMTDAAGRARPGDQIAAIATAMDRVTEVVASGVEVVLIHGNGPQVGNLLVKNELAASVVPPVPLDWCGAQTQATIGFIVLDALEAALSRRGVPRQACAVITRTLVDGSDPGFTQPTKPIGRYLPQAEAEVLIGHGQTWQDRGEKGWRRVVASPEPLQILDARAIATLVSAGFIVVANGGGGIPVVREPDGGLRGVEAVIDKDLGAALLARVVDADVLVIATDVPAAMVGYGTSAARALERVSRTELAGYAAAGAFGAGSMGPKVAAALRFLDSGGAMAVISSLDQIAVAVRGQAGTVVLPDPGPADLDRGPTAHPDPMA